MWDHGAAASPEHREILSERQSCHLHKNQANANMNLDCVVCQHHRELMKGIHQKKKTNQTDLGELFLGNI